MSCKHQFNLGCCKATLYLWNLTLLLIPPIIVVTIIYEEAHSAIYMPFSTMVASFILFTNFPNLVLLFHKRPLYYDDLAIKDFSQEDEQIYNDSFRTQYQKIFKWIVTVTSSIMIGILTEAWYIRHDYAGNSDTKTDEAPTENGVMLFEATTIMALAAIYSLAAMYKNFIIYFGKALVFILKLYKRREIERQRLASDFAANLVINSARNQEEITHSFSRRSQSHTELNKLGLNPEAITYMGGTILH